MVSRQDATLNLASLIKHSLEAGGEVSGSGLLLPSDAQLAEDGLRLAAPLNWELSVRTTGGDDDYLLSGNVSGTAIMECRRCLTDVKTKVRAELIYSMSYQPGSKELKLVETGEDDEDRLVFGQPEVDFAPLLRQIFAIELPATVLCQESCKGLSLDGVNLNEFPEHKAPATDNNADKDKPPFAALKDFKL